MQLRNLRQNGPPDRPRRSNLKTEAFFLNFTKIDLKNIEISGSLHRLELPRLWYRSLLNLIGFLRNLQLDPKTHATAISKSNLI